MALPAIISAGQKTASLLNSASKANKASGTASRLKKAANTAGAVGTGAWGVDMVLDFVKDNYPDAYQAMTSQLEKFGIDIEDPALREATGQTRDQLVAMMAQNGVGEEAIENLGLTKLESAQYLKLLKTYRANSTELHDSAQVERSSTGERALDIDIMNVDIAACCNELGLVGPKRARKLFQLARVINSIRESDVQNFERHEALFGSIRVVR